MNYIEFVRKSDVEKGKKGRLFVMPSDEELCKQLKEIVENSNYMITDFRIDHFTVENWNWLLKYDDIDWIDEYCLKIKKHDKDLVL